MIGQGRPRLEAVGLRGAKPLPGLV